MASLGTDKTVLCVGVDSYSTNLVKQILQGDGINVISTASLSQAVDLHGKLDPFGILLNSMGSAADMGAAIKQMRTMSSTMRIVAAVQSSSVSDRTIQECLESGANTFVIHPITSADLRAAFGLNGKSAAAPSHPSDCTATPCEHCNVSAIVGECDAIRDLRAQIVQITTVDKSLQYPRPVLVVGETGTGKQLVARALRCQGPRANRPFVEVNCAAIPATLLEAELFGFEKGAFTDAKASKPGLFEQADGGTLFLDEICSMDPMLQVKLLKAIEQRSIRRLGGTTTKSVDVRIIAASNWVAQAVSGNRGVRPDLYYRLSLFCLTISPLRKRGRDILVLARHVLERLGREAGHRPKRLTKDAEILLMGYAWPGNVRELINVLERAALLHGGDQVEARHLEIRPDHSGERALKVKDDGSVQVDFTSGPIDLEAIERQLITRALAHAQWNRGEAAKLLGISKETLRYRIEKFDLRPESLHGGIVGLETSLPISRSTDLPM